MRFTRLFVCVVAALWLGEARAASCVGADMTAERLLALSMDWRPGSGTTPPVEIPSRPRSDSALAGQAIDVTITPPTAQSVIWAGATYLAAGRRTDGTGQPRLEGLRASAVIPRTTDGVMPPPTLRVQTPPKTRYVLDETWLVAIVACNPTDGAVLGHTVVPLTVTSQNWSIIWAALLTGGFYVGLVAIARRCNAPRIAAATAAGRWGRFDGWGPVFISQDASGDGSLARLQLLLFSLIVGFVSLRILLGTAEVAQLSTDVMWLLGIAVVSTGVSRLVPGNAGLGTTARMWLVERGILRPSPHLPHFADTVSADGEIDVTRVQAVIFTAVILGGLLQQGGFGDLSRFVISDEVKLLLGLSQAAYIGGKAVPTETARQLDAAVKRLMAAPDADAIRAADPLLAEVLGKRFDRAALNAL